MAQGWLRAVVVAFSVAAVLGIAYLGAGAPPLPRNLTDLNAAISGEDAVAPGFVGVLEFGAWRLICAPGPQSALPALSSELQSIDPIEEPGTTNTCRVNQEVGASDTPGHVILAVNLSMIGPQRRPALMLRIPSTAHAGDAITVEMSNAEAMQTMVRECFLDECVAANDLSQADWRSLIDTEMLQITFPSIDGQTAYVDLPVEGLAEAVAAMDVAQDSPPAPISP